MDNLVLSGENRQQNTYSKQHTKQVQIDLQLLRDQRPDLFKTPPSAPNKLKNSASSVRLSEKTNNNQNVTRPSYTQQHLNKKKKRKTNQKSPSFNKNFFQNVISLKEKEDAHPVHLQSTFMPSSDSNFSQISLNSLIKVFQIKVKRKKPIQQKAHTEQTEQQLFYQQSNVQRFKDIQEASIARQISSLLQEQDFKIAKLEELNAEMNTLFRQFESIEDNNIFKKEERKMNDIKISIEKTDLNSSQEEIFDSPLNLPAFSTLLHPGPVRPPDSIKQEGNTQASLSSPGKIPKNNFNKKDKPITVDASNLKDRGSISSQEALDNIYNMQKQQQLLSKPTNMAVSKINTNLSRSKSFSERSHFDIIKHWQISKQDQRLNPTIPSSTKSGNKKLQIICQSNLKNSNSPTTKQKKTQGYAKNNSPKKSETNFGNQLQYQPNVDQISMGFSNLKETQDKNWHILDYQTKNLKQRSVSKEKQSILYNKSINQYRYGQFKANSHDENLDQYASSQDSPQIYIFNQLKCQGAHGKLHNMSKEVSLIQFDKDSTMPECEISWQGQISKVTIKQQKQKQ